MPPVAAGLPELAVQVLAPGERDGVDEDVELAAGRLADLLGRGRRSPASLVTSQGNVWRAGRGGGQLGDVLLEPLALVGEDQPRPGVRKRFRDGPGQGALVGDARHERRLPGQVDGAHGARVARARRMSTRPARPIAGNPAAGARA